MTKMKQAILLILCAVLVACASVMGTLAYLQMQTAPVKNTFTTSNISITLTESENLDLKMVPGKDLIKDPLVTVEYGSEDCWLFVKIEKSESFDGFMTFAMADGWTALDGQEGVYYREVKADDTVRAFPVLSENKVTVLAEVTKEAMNALTEETQPTLTVTAYACQREGIATAAEAWTELNSLQNPNP